MRYQKLTLEQLKFSLQYYVYLLIGCSQAHKVMFSSSDVLRVNKGVYVCDLRMF